MANVLIVAYLLIVLALIAVILLQRSEGGGLGMGGSSSGGLITVRGTANLLTRTTAILAVLFFATAIGLTVLSEIDRETDAILESAGDGAEPGSVLDALNQLQGDTDAGGSLPVPEEGDAAPATDGAPAGAGSDAPDLPVPTAPGTSN